MLVTKAVEIFAPAVTPNLKARSCARAVILIAAAVNSKIILFMLNYGVISINLPTITFLDCKDNQFLRLSLSTRKKHPYLKQKIFVCLHSVSSGHGSDDAKNMPEKFILMT